MAATSIEVKKAYLDYYRRTRIAGNRPNPFALWAKYRYEPSTKKKKKRRRRATTLRTKSVTRGLKRAGLTKEEIARLRD